ncbi:MAG: DUF4397 domain-containing protein [Solirubrobacteraceae bacterium]|jgi:hypothetical protein
MGAGGYGWSWRKSLAVLVLGLCVCLLWPVEALARALVRVFHAVPGVGRARIQFIFGSQTVDLGTIGFAQSTSWHSVRTGSFVWRLLTPAGKQLASGSATIGGGAYTIVVLARSQGVSLGVYRDRAGEPGTSLLRVIHAAPELGSPSLKLDSRIVVDQLDYTQATPYLSVSPGIHSLAAMRAGDPMPFLSLKGVRLASGQSYSAIVVGSRGERTRVVVVTDRGPPLTVPSRRDDPQMSSGGEWMTVRAGDSLWTIARSYCGPSAGDETVYRNVVAIWKMNAGRIGTGDPNLIFPGQRLKMP